MKCKNCGSNLRIQGNHYICDNCDSIFLKEEFTPLNNYANEFKISGGVLVSYLGNNSDVTIPEGVVSIGSRAFKDNLLIQSITFSNSVVSIENNAFEGCKNLRKLYNFEYIKSYGDEAFKFSGLRHVSINNKVEFIGKYCFAKMQDLEVVTYMPDKNLKLNHTFAFCPNLNEVEMDKLYFFPSLRPSLGLKNNPNNKRPTWNDAFVSTPYIKKIFNKYMESYKKGICPECGGKIRKGLFHAKCKNCKIDYKN